MGTGEKEELKDFGLAVSNARPLDWYSYTAGRPIIPQVTVMPTAEPAAVLISSIFASKIFGVTPKHLRFHFSGQKPFVASTE